MALRYMESISSMSAESLNSLRKNFIKLMKTGLDLEVFTAKINKNLTDFVYESMLLAGKHEKEAKYIEGTANITSGIIGIGMSALAFGAGMKSEMSIRKNNRGLKRIQSIRSKMTENTGGIASGKSSTTPGNGSFELGHLKSRDLRTTKVFPSVKKNIGATANTKYGKQIKGELKKKEAQYEEAKRSASTFEAQLGNFLQTLNTSTGNIVQGAAKIKEADEQYLQALYNAGVEVARNVSEGNRSIGQTEHEMAMRFYDLASGIDRIVEDLDRHSQLRG